MGGKGIVVLSDASFKADVLDSEMPVLVDFTATWCGPCKKLVPVLEQAAEEYQGRVKVGRLDVDDNRETAGAYLIRSIPTLLLFRGGQVVEQSVGLVNAAKLQAMLEKVL